MPTCFVIQPFDNGGPFDKRCKEVVEPAIKAADLEAYRVDQDPSAQILIASIEAGIQASEVCVADITENNPNVWFEVGFAIAAQKQVIFICSNERTTAFPFDVQHRNITKYATTSPRDFAELQETITKRIKAVLKSNKELGIISQLSPTLKTEGLTQHEVGVLIILMEDTLTPNANTPPDNIRERMRRHGFTDVAASIAADSLIEQGYAEHVSISNNYNYEEYVSYRLTAKGRQWMRDNQDKLTLRIEKKDDEDIPF